MLKQWLNKKYLDEKEIRKINSDFSKAKPYPHFALNNFFNRDRISKLRKEVLMEDFKRQDRDLFSFYNTKELLYSKSGFIKEFYNLLSSKEFLGFMEKLTDEKRLKGIDMHAHIFKQGDYLLFHDDVVEGRGIAYIVYLSKGFTPKDGGRLQLYDIKSPVKPVRQILPLFNSFACFKVSKKSLHAVEEVMTNKERLTVGGWFYGNKQSN